MDRLVKGNKVPKGERLYRIGKVEFIELLESLRTSIGYQVKTDVKLFLETKKTKELNSNLPKSGFEDKKAFVLLGNEFIKGKARYRGDNWYHWLLPHKSWRFKTSKSNLYNGVRKINFIIPKSQGLLGNHLSYKLANAMNLLAPESSMVSLSVNEKYNGIKLMVEQIDESFLRNNGRMANDVYKGDNIGSKKNLGVRVFSVFDVPAIWDKASINNHYPDNSRVPLETMLLQLNKKDNSLLDIESFANNMAFLDLTSSFHYDAVHNWVLYYDSYYEKFYPIIWDTLGWQKAWTSKKSVNIIHSSKLFESLYNDYKYLTAKYYSLYDFFTNKEKAFLRLMDEEIDELQSKVDLAGYHFHAGGTLRSPKETKKDIGKFREEIVKRFHFVKSKFFGDVNKSGYSYTFDADDIRLSISDNKLINEVRIKLKKKVDFKKVYLKYIQNGREIKAQVPFKLLENNTLLLEVDLLAQANQFKGKPFPSSSFIKYETATYDIEIEGLKADDVKSIALSYLGNENESFIINKVGYFDAQAFKGQKNIIKKYQTQITEVWSGTKNISGFNTIYNDIVIKKGAKIIFDENATIKFLGKVSAIGTREDPIVFEAKNKNKPWNAVVLKGAKADNSVFKYSIFRDGSGDKGDLYEYTAMFSVHDVKNLIVEESEFYDSHKSDDMVHIMYSDASFKNSKFVRALSDAVDVDISDVVFDNCEFLDSGNDSIDLMTSNAVVINTKFRNSKDKGISIGEKSNLLAINNLIEGSEIGMQSKDTSKAYIYNSSFINNKKAIDAYHKNWRYSEGGSIYLDKCVFENNQFNATVGKKSKVVINDSNIDSIDNFDLKSRQKEKIKITTETAIVPLFSEPLPVNTYKTLITRKHGFNGN
jgi:hypothetical protein